MIDALKRIPDFCTLFPSPRCLRPVPQRIIEECEPAPCQPPCPPEPDPRVTFASYLERQNLEDRIEWSPAVSTRTRTEPAAPRSKPDVDGAYGAKLQGPAPARLADVLPVPPQVRRVEVETAYRLHLATGRPSGVLDVMA